MDFIVRSSIFDSTIMSALGVSIVRFVRSLSTTIFPGFSVAMERESMPSFALTLYSPPS